MRLHGLKPPVKDLARAKNFYETVLKSMKVKEMSRQQKVRLLIESAEMIWQSHLGRDRDA
jgi:predicted enzyme related to lactoylglutathione lyase